MKKLKNQLNLLNFTLIFLFSGIILVTSPKPGSASAKKETHKKTTETILSETDFRSVPSNYKPWVYYWWLKGNVTKEQITHDLEEMQKKGIGGFLLFDSRGYWDDYYGKTGHIPVPLTIKYEFMSPEWRSMVKYTMQEANRFGLKMSINIANTGGSLRGPWNMKEDGPKQLIWSATNVSGPAKLSIRLNTPADKKYFHDVALMAVKINSDKKISENPLQLNTNWKTMSTPAEDAPVANEIIHLENKVDSTLLQWDVPNGEWRILRFGYHVIGDEGSVDILNPDAVTKYFHLMGSEILKDAGPLAGVTLTHFYNVSWEGGQPDWTMGFENYFQKYCGYAIQQYMPILAGISAKDKAANERFVLDYLHTVSDCFKHNGYETIGKLCHAHGVQWHSEDGGPWPRTAPMFKEADQLTFWGRNDMPQGEFWCTDWNDLTQKSNIRYAAMAGHIYGHPLIAVEAFTHMGRHWTKYPAYLKPFADINLIDGANFFIWHTFTASPAEAGKPGYEYFAGTHINTNVTWWNEAGGIFDYLGRCQYLLRKGKFVADICCFVSDKNYITWGRGEKWNPKSTLAPVKGFTYDLLSSEVLINNLTVKDGKLVLPDGMNYKMLVVDLDEPVIPLAVLKKIDTLVNKGATIVLGKTKPLRTPGIRNYPDSDKEICTLSDKLWAESSEQMLVRKMGKGKIYTGASMNEILNHNNSIPDFVGPFEYIHRKSTNVDIYFVSGEGKAECTFRVKNKKPEIWDPVTGHITGALGYNSTSDGRTTVLLNLPQNGSAFVVFRGKPEKNHTVSVDAPELPEAKPKNEGGSTLIFWKSGNYSFTQSNGNIEEIPISLTPPLEITNTWKITFSPATGVKAFKATFDKLTLWNENTDPVIKYFSGTATYTNTFTLTAEQAQNPARLQLGEVYDICRVWVNGKDLGNIWTAPWRVTLTGALKNGTNHIKIEVTNCWANRLIGDARLPENQWTTKTNVRRVPDRSQYKAGHQAFSATDELMPSGLVGPVRIEFGKEQIK